MATVSSNFTAVGNGSTYFAKMGDEINFSVSGTFVGTVVLEKSDNNGLAWYQVGSPKTAAASSTVQVDIPGGGIYRFRCSAYTSGTIVTTLSDVNSTRVILKDLNGVERMIIREDGIQIVGDVAMSGSVTSSASAGAVNGATVSAVEYSTNGVNKTVITLASTPLPVVSVTTGNGVGGVKVYDMPAGWIRVLGCTASLSIAVQTQSDFTDATPEGDIGIGSVAPANADAFGTDATDDDIGTGAAFTMSSYAATANIAPEASLNFNGTSSALDVYVNALVDAADIDNDVSTNLLISGTITIVWVNLGDY